ncbi:Bifunctional ligase/repressor BirA [bacterium HR29]|nr:Bifunctional ligase/repressor BirA [bacterium HR29]
MLLASDAPLARIAAELCAARGNYVSGERLAQSLGLSRNAVWKHVLRLRRLGYQVESSRRLGHRLVSPSSRPFPWEVAQALRTRTFGRAYRFVDRADSTQAIARAWAANGAPEGAVVLAEEQTAGRGRKGASFIAPRGGLWCSIVLRPQRPATEAPVLAMLGAAAAAATLARLGAPDVSLWWPKEVLVRGRKAGGVLAEVAADQDDIREAILGIGLNINLRPEDFPPGIREHAVSLLMLSGEEVSLARAAAVLFEELESLADAYRSEGPPAVARAWRAFPGLEGRRVRVQTPEGEVRGVVLGVSDAGALRVARGSEEVAIASGIVLPEGEA